MKKKNKYKIESVSAQEVAKNLRKGMGREKGFKLADNLVNRLKNMSGGDVNGDMYDVSDIREQESVWKQVRGILAK